MQTQHIRAIWTSVADFVVYLTGVLFWRRHTGDVRCLDSRSLTSVETFHQLLHYWCVLTAYSSWMHESAGGLCVMSPIEYVCMWASAHARENTNWSSSRSVKAALCGFTPQGTFKLPQSHHLLLTGTPSFSPPTPDDPIIVVTHIFLLLWLGGVNSIPR